MQNVVCFICPMYYGLWPSHHNNVKMSVAFLDLIWRIVPESMNFIKKFIQNIEWAVNNNHNVIAPASQPTIIMRILNGSLVSIGIVFEHINMRSTNAYSHSMQRNK